MKSISSVVKNQKILFISLVFAAFLALINESFWTQNNIFGLLIQLPASGMAALGLALSLICGELNISMGSMMAFSGVFCAMLIPHVGFGPAVLLTLLASAILGAVTGGVVSFLKIDSFVATLAMMILVRGIALALCNQTPVVVTDSLAIDLGMRTIGPIPVITILFLIFILVFEFLLKYTVFGRNLYAVGGSQEIAKSTGTNVKFYIFIIFVIFAVLSAVGGIFLMARLNTGSPIIADDGPLTVIPMVILGGTALSGGKGSALNTLGGVLFMSLLMNAMNLYNITLNYQLLIKGVILLIMVVWDKYMENRNKKV